jgi:hypothetical protein
MLGRLWFTTAIMFLLIPSGVSGQSSSTIDVELGLGFAAGGGLENPAPSLPTLSLGAGFWLTERWGLAVAHVRSYGEDLSDPPVDSTDRVFAGAEELRYTRAVGRYRRDVGAAGDIVLGFGLVLGASFVDIVFLKTPIGLQRLRPTTKWGGFTVEGYFQRAILGHLGVRAGGTLDTGTETTVFQPVVLGIVTF